MKGDFRAQPGHHCRMSPLGRRPCLVHDDIIMSRFTHLSVLKVGSALSMRFMLYFQRSTGNDQSAQNFHFACVPVRSSIAPLKHTHMIVIVVLVLGGGVGAEVGLVARTVAREGGVPRQCG